MASGIKHICLLLTLKYAKLSWLQREVYRGLVFKFERFILINKAMIAKINEFNLLLAVK